MTTLIDALLEDAAEHEVAGRTIQAANARAAAENLAVMAPWGTDRLTGAQLITLERMTHAARGFDLEHDLAHDEDELIAAAVAFIHGNPELLPEGWADVPWVPEGYPHTPKACVPRNADTRAGLARNLVIAGSLLAAQLDCMGARGEMAEAEAGPG